MDTGTHFEGVIDMNNVDSRYWPSRPRTAELHIERNGDHEYFTSAEFHSYDVLQLPSDTDNPSVSCIYVRMTFGNIFKAVLIPLNSKDKQSTPRVQKDASTSQSRRRIKTGYMQMISQRYHTSRIS